MSQLELENIRTILSGLELHPTYLEHEPVLTSEDAARTRGFELRQGIKALLFTDGKDDWVIVNVPGDRKVDAKKVADNRGWAKKAIRMATPEEVIEKTGCEIGSVPPFGHKSPLPILVDLSVFENEVSTYNIGLLTHSLKIATLEMKTLFTSLGAETGIFVKEPPELATA